MAARPRARSVCCLGLRRRPECPSRSSSNREATPAGGDPWIKVQEAFVHAALGRKLAPDIPPSVGATWRAMDADERDALVVLSAMDVTREQIADIFFEQKQPSSSQQPS